MLQLLRVAALFASTAPAFAQYTLTPQPSQPANPGPSIPGVCWQDLTQAGANQIAAGLNELYIIDPGAASDAAQAIGATGPGNPNGDPGSVQVLEIQDVGLNSTEPVGGAAPAGEGAVGINLDALDSALDVAITLVHELKHVEANDNGGPLPTSLDAIMAQFPHLTDAEVLTVSTCNHAAVHAETALQFAYACFPAMGCAELGENCASFLEEYLAGQRYASECDKLASELPDTDPDVADAVLAAADKYSGVSVDDMRSMCNCCHFFDECNQ